MSKMTQMQMEILEWARINFPDEKEHHLLLGVQEELGELSHAVLKQEMNIRNDEDHQSDIFDAIGDLMVYLLEFCTHRNINLEDCVSEVWEKVKQRNWQKFPVNGVSE